MGGGVKMSSCSGLGLGRGEQKWEPVLKCCYFVHHKYFALIKNIFYRFMNHTIRPFKVPNSVV